jgi:Na+/H+ antiporter NhaC
MASIVKSIVSRAKTAVGGQVAVWLMGLMIFFDDYSNTLVVGNTARSLTDHLKVSREKLAYIVDSTAAPVACIALITTWIGYQIGLVDQALGSIPDLQHVQAYSVFIHSIPYSFYPILAIVFVLMIASSGLDFGPMYKAEKRARNGSVKPETGEALPAIHGDELEPKEKIPLRAVNAFVPIITLVVALMVSLFVLGEGDTLVSILETTSPYQAMMYSSFVGVLVAATMSIGQRILSVHETVDAWYGGLRATLFGMIILVLAWSLSDLTATLNTASYLVTLLADSLPVALIPAIVFILAAITAFTTGTSWGTMAIVGGMHILYSSVACCLAGAVWGDHCSPISDTTVLSSVASGCDHIEHVRTQLPYALLVGVVALALGTIPGGFGMPPWISIVLGIGVLWGILKFFSMRSKPIIGIPCDRRIYTGQPFHMAGEKYLTAIVHAADAIPLLIPVLEDQIDFDVLLGHLDGILLSGSYSNVEPHHYDGEPSEAGTLHDPYRDAVTLPMIRHVLDMGMPLFAICRGYQELNVALGGTLHQKVHEATICISKTRMTR